MKYNTATPYIASYVIIHQDKKIAFVLRENTPWMNGYYGLPSGKVEKGETYTEAAIREAKEETGVKIQPKDLDQLLVLHRKEPEMTWVDIFFEAKTWQGEPFNAEPDMHSELAWFDLKHLPKNVIPSVRYALEQIEAGKTYGEFGWLKT